MDIIGNNGTLKKSNTKLNIDVMRKRREKECFSIVNRGVLWYNCLTIEQRAELNGWYHAWLNVTETGLVPPRPMWLDDKIEKEEILL